MVEHITTTMWANSPVGRNLKTFRQKQRYY